MRERNLGERKMGKDFHDVLKDGWNMSNLESYLFILDVFPS